MEHFGVRVYKKKYSLKLNREEFALINTKPSLHVFDNLIKENAYTDDSYKEYRKEWCEEYRKLCLKNFDLNMQFFERLNRKEFNAAIEKFLSKFIYFNDVKDLFQYQGVSGYYMMVLDEYKQIYIGKSCDIKRRIQQHWTNTKAFDRILLPMYAVDTSCFSIDFFRALDTTRLYVWERILSDNIERELLENFPRMFCTNRIGGDITSMLEALLTINNRCLG